jgi:histone acetyltransferase (RNA polymerase elongator complex component)
VEEYVESGMRWIDSIINIIEESLSASLGDKERDAYVAQHGRLASLRQYGHWVKKITYGGTVEIVDRESIEDLLDKLSSSDELVNVYLENIKDYISSSTVSIIAIPAYKCPNCQGQMNGDDLRHPHLIQLDALMTFFTLKDLRLLRVKS